MLNRFNKFLKELELKHGTSSELLEKVQSNLKVQFPLDYLEFMKESNGAEGFVGDSYLDLWSIEELISSNNAMEVKKRLPGVILFASNGGGEAYGFDFRNDEVDIVQVPFIGMALDTIQPCGRTFLEFLEYLSSQI